MDCLVIGSQLTGHQRKQRYWYYRIDYIQTSPSGPLHLHSFFYAAFWADPLSPSCCKALSLISLLNSSSSNYQVRHPFFPPKTYIPCLAVLNWPLLPVTALSATGQSQPELCANIRPRPPCLLPLRLRLAIFSRLPT